MYGLKLGCDGAIIERHVTLNNMVITYGFRSSLKCVICVDHCMLQALPAVCNLKATGCLYHAYCVCVVCCMYVVLCVCIVFTISLFVCSEGHWMQLGSDSPSTPEHIPDWLPEEQTLCIEFLLLCISYGVMI